MTTELKRTRTAPEQSPEHAQNDQHLSRARSTPEDETNNRLFPPQFLDDHGSHRYHFHSDDDEIIDEDSPSDSSSQTVDIDDKEDRDVEANRPQIRREKSTKSIKDATLVSWESDKDPENPKNWTYRKKWAATLIISAFTFISPVSSSMTAPALNVIGEDLGINNNIEKSLTLSIFVLAYAVGPLLLGPLSEIYGRVIVIQLANLFFLVFNIGCGFAQTKGQLIAFRFLSGLGGSAPLSIGGGVLSDVWHAEERGKSISIYSLAPLLGPAVGPIAGGFIAENTTWRWCFWSTSLVDAGIQCLGLIYLRETYAPKILAIKAKRLRKETGNPKLHTEWELPDRTFGKVLRTSLVRPFRLLGTQIIIQVLALYMAYLYGLLYLVLSTFPSVWEGIYHESVGIGGLNYISLGVGFFIGAQSTARMNDKIYIKLKQRNNNIGRPEFRVPLMIPGALLVPIGLFIYGWTANRNIHWIAPNIGAVIFSAGSIMGFQCTQTYIVDAYPRFAASAVASAVVLRSLAGFGFPLFAPYLYSALHLNWGNSLLAFVGIAIGIPSPFLLWKYGEGLRERSTYAAG
ncbi:hypothetical protein LTR84_007753 [Exophiala bonariae]|uniref:Major facilitator superfamily (MFS) profile domain-containing protein n=1 Tax=Exophiala bonariae TaxID=1690606 RepID=A0AAV9NKZ1_9EURO|nr:hypothetical protein LTR84_007753 [Exophiala bonariae]